MNILIISDTHGAHHNLDMLLRKIPEPDVLIHLGDVYGEMNYIKGLISGEVHLIGGNNDFFSRLPREKEITLCGKKIFMTHGHTFYVNAGEEHLIREARIRGADIVMYGHTHRPSATQTKEGILVLNPGSISCPRQADRRASYILMRIDADGEAEYQIAYV